MFTGIVTDIGSVQSIDNKAGNWRIAIQTSFDLTQTDIGASIACAGCCLTVVQKESDIFYVDVSNETLSKTNIGSWGVGSQINLERSLKVGDELGGHIVSGHVDGLARVRAIEKEGDSYEVVLMMPEDIIGLIAIKGSVALDGVSLTVNDVEKQHFAVNIIPHTWENTTLSQLKYNDTAHLEVDPIARYVAQALAGIKP